MCVLERRHVLGGAAVTEEIIPGLILKIFCKDMQEFLVSGFKFSRASYLLSLFRPEIIKDLKLMVWVLIFKGFCKNKNANMQYLKIF